MIKLVDRTKIPMILPDHGQLEHPHGALFTKAGNNLCLFCGDFHDALHSGLDCPRKFTSNLSFACDSWIYPERSLVFIVSQSVQPAPRRREYAMTVLGFDPNLANLGYRFSNGLGLPQAAAAAAAGSSKKEDLYEWLKTFHGVAAADPPFRAIAAGDDLAFEDFADLLLTPKLKKPRTVGPDTAVAAAAATDTASAAAAATDTAAAAAAAAAPSAAAAAAVAPQLQIAGPFAQAMSLIPSLNHDELSELRAAVFRAQLALQASALEAR